MKIIKISTLVLLGGALLFNASCKKTFYTEANFNPNAPLVVTPATLLSTVEGSLAYTQGGDMSRFASMFVQQTNGVARQSQAYNSYLFTGQDVDGLWGNMYTSVMENNLQLMLLSDSKQYNVYSGISRVLMAYSLQITVDNWGNIPYSQAFQGAVKLQPAYDNDQALYGVIQTLCDSAIVYMNMTEPGFAVPGGEDVLYSGNTTQWIEFAHAIKARTYIHQAKSTNSAKATMATKAMAEIALSFTGNSDNAKYVFGSSSNANGPWFQFNNQRGDISFATSTLAFNLIANNDPRYPFMIDSANDPYGIGLAGMYGADAGTVEFITYDELQFMQAEATIVSGGTVTDAQAAYQNGITSSMSKLGVAGTDIATYLAANGTLTTANAMAKIGYEVNVALYLNPEAWTTWRRTGFPVLTSMNPSGSAVPRRLLYPQTEESYNKANVPAGSTMYTPLIFWDK